MAQGTIRVGIGGWNYEPWRGTFYPPGLRQKDELGYAVSHLTAIEINATYYRLQSPKSFAAWAKAAPDGFVYAVKASRYCTNRNALAEAGESVARFVNQGLAELGGKLGPIVWQFAPTKPFDPDDFGAFLELLPASVDGVPLRHALEVRHESFRDPIFVALARAAGAAIVFADHGEYPRIADQTASFTYARLMQARGEEPLGYSPQELDRWAAFAREWAAGETPKGLETVAPAGGQQAKRDVFLFFINGAKVRAPAAAQAMIARLADPLAKVQ